MRCTWNAAFRLTTAALVLALAGPVRADDPPVDYTGHKLVSVRLETPRALERMLEISPDHWTCSHRLGEVPFRVSPEQLDALKASGLGFRVLHDNVQAMIDEERAALARPTRAWFDTYHPYNEVSDYIDTLAALRPDLASRVAVGTSLEGRAILGLRITGPGSSVGRPGLLFNGCQHAREWISVMVPMYVADRLIRNYDSDTRIKGLVDRCVFYIVPIVNPDGYVHTWGPNRLWRKNRRNNGDGSFGVDNNRNWGYQWGGAGSSGTPASETYRGTAPFSEPETAAMRDFILARPELAVHIDFHSFSQLILSPWTYTVGEPNEPDGTVFRALNADMQSAIFGVHGLTYAAGPSGVVLYVASGGAKDWTYGAAGLWAWSIELRPADDPPGFILPASQIVPTAEENFEAVVVLASTLLHYVFPTGQPGILAPHAPGTIDLNIMEVSATLATGTARRYARLGGSGAFTDASLAPLGGNAYRATLPAAPCGATIHYYFEAQTTAGEFVRSPAAAPTSYYSALVNDVVVIVDDDMELDRGWTVGAAGDTATSGIWGRMDPQGTVNGSTPVQPEDDHTPAPGVICFVTDGRAGSAVGTYDVDGGRTTLVSPVVDLTGKPETRISYWRWYSNTAGSAANADVFRVEATSNGTTWVAVETVGPTGPQANGGWNYHEFRVADIVAVSATVRVRFIAEDAGQGSIIEAAVDDFRVVNYSCPTPPPCPGDADGDRDVDQDDMDIVLFNFGTSQPAGTNGDVDGDGDVDQDDVDVVLFGFGTSCP